MRDLGRLIRTARLARGYSLEGLGKQLGVSRSAVNQWELGTSLPETHRLPDLVRLLELDPAILVSVQSPEADATASPAKMEDAQSTPVPVMLPQKDDMPLDVPLLGTAYGGESGDFVMDAGDGGHVRRPPALRGRTDVFSLFVRGESMTPRYFPGELIYLEKRRPPQNGDFVVIEVRNGSDDGRDAFLKRLVATTPTRIKLEQYNPGRVIEIDRKKVVQILRVMSLADLLGV